MRITSISSSCLFASRALVAFLLCSAGALLAVYALNGRPSVAPSRDARSEVAFDRSAIRRIFDVEKVLARNGLLPSTQRRLAMRAPMAARAAQPSRARLLRPLVSAGVTPGSSLPVRDLPDVAPNFTQQQVPKLEREGRLRHRGGDKIDQPGQSDPVVQRGAAVDAMPPVGLSFEGMSITSSCGNCLPPDTVGAVGPNHYVQMVNSHFQIFDKSGATLVTPKPINSLWSTLPGTTCNTHNNGDPIPIYDQLADRWLLSQFTVQSGSEAFAECIAISKTPDPTGEYWLYQFDESFDTFPDYPHLGLWPDAYYMSTNQFSPTAVLSDGAGAWAFEREKMLAGQTARYVYFDLSPLSTPTYTPGGQLPASLEGMTPPPAGAPGLFVEVNDTNTPNTPPMVGFHDEMLIWEFKVDWTDPTKSTFGVGSTAPSAHPTFSGMFQGDAGQPNHVIPVADYVQNACLIENGPNDCAPQRVTGPNIPQYLDVLGDRLMHRVVYRNFPDREALMVHHTADVIDDQISGVGRTGLRWYEVRNVNSTPTVFQQGTFGPLDPMNPLWRWMGSISMDRSGNIALGYSASGQNHYPSLHYAGRIATDPLNELSQGEAILFLGQGVEIQTGVFPFRNRWGDYSAIVVDPTDDCTFWYTNEYARSTPTTILGAQWMTRIGTFKFPLCGPPPAPIKAESVKTHGDGNTYAIGLPLAGDPGIECRVNTGDQTTGPNAGRDHRVVVTFAVPVTLSGATVASNDPTMTETATTSVDGNTVTVDLHDVDDAQRIDIHLTNVSDGSTGLGTVTIPMIVLAGDTNADTRVNVGDTNQTKENSGQLTSADNARIDVNIDGRINVGDVNFVKAHAGSPE